MKKLSATLSLLAIITFTIGKTSPAAAESIGYYINDATITAKVKEAILADSQLKVLQVKVDTRQGIVFLSGTVDSKDQENEAVKVTGQIHGVSSVTDDLSIQTTSAE